MEQKIKTFLRNRMSRSQGFFYLVFRFLYLFAKYIKILVSTPQSFYEIWVAKFLARRFFFLYWPLGKIFKWLDFRFLINISPGTGHTIPEFDYFFRLIYTGKLDPSKKYIAILRNSYYFRDFLKLYGKNLYFFSTNTLLYDLLLPFFMKDRRICIDMGLARIKWHFPPDAFDGRWTPNRPYVFQYSVFLGMQMFKNYFALKRKSLDYFPLLNISVSPADLLKELEVENDRFCLVQIKEVVMNATAMATDPKTLLPMLDYLRENGYKFVFAGREKMPVEFSRFGMINYSESPLANFKNDILLFKSCHLAIVNGSGVSNFAETLNKPYLFFNFWHIALCPVSP